MILGGDEFLRTQQGNNNAWCQDNDQSWVDWSLAAAQRRVPAVRQEDDRPAARPIPCSWAADLLLGRPPGPAPEILWHGVEPSHPDFSPTSQSLALALDGRFCGRTGVLDRDFYVAMNSGTSPLDFKVPASPTGRPWRRIVDTALESPEDYADFEQAPPIPILYTYRVQEHAMVILISEP